MSETIDRCVTVSTLNTRGTHHAAIYALLLASGALEGLGDLYAINTFGGKTANNVSLTAIKGFSERSGRTIRRRIAGIEPSQSG